MKEQFVPYELALKLKELGFDEECLGSFTIKDCSLQIDDMYSLPSIVKAPLWQQAFDWFRKRYSKNSWIGDHYSSSTPGYFEYTYHISIMQGGIIKSGRYKTYQEARQACLEKLIELCKKN
jgi:hypothetical protein